MSRVSLSNSPEGGERVLDLVFVMYSWPLHTILAGVKMNKIKKFSTSILYRRKIDKHDHSVSEFSLIIISSSLLRHSIA